MCHVSCAYLEIKATIQQMNWFRFYEVAGHYVPQSMIPKCYAEVKKKKISYNSFSKITMRVN